MTKRMTVEMAVELGWDFADREWPNTGGTMINVVARKGETEFTAGFHASRKKTDRPQALRLVLRTIAQHEERH